MELSRNTRYTIEELFNKPYELVKIMLEINAEINIKNLVYKAKLNAIANRIDTDKLLNLESIIEYPSGEEKKFVFDIRELEKLPGVKITRTKKGK